LKAKINLFFRLLAIAILVQTLFFKFTGAEESKFIFSSLGVEPWGRWFSGLAELLASILLLFPMTQVLGASLGVAIMVGAILGHLFVLGLVVQNDGGLLFGLACTVLVSCLTVLVLNKNQLQKQFEFLLGYARGKFKK
jgi:hypothetical protein